MIESDSDDFARLSEILVKISLHKQLTFLVKPKLLLPLVGLYLRWSLKLHIIGFSKQRNRKLILMGIESLENRKRVRLASGLGSSELTEWRELVPHIPYDLN
ncbi:hypothetical protein [Cohnella sp.]|uniref:hypothetical protein n=1 Tax=Cohnella sp. TaxID=1883426 RepID=UPI0037044966